MKKIVTYVCVALFGAVALSGSLQAGTDKELKAFEAAIKEKYDLKVKAFAENDADTIADKFYSEDVVSVDPSGKVTLGREALRKEYEHIVPTATVSIESVHTFVDGDAGWDWANFHVTPTDPNEKPFTFIILFLWAKENGEWICKGDQYVVGEL
ncbi:nuclear transport factor 2 family protein [Emcibacter sp.]|uniref:YybH family protein n=1 Tax=Emcibacter sp. TaxID=1979954 RepID=UPI002AA7ACEA|nr:nuclear transport factor 2 family protein [Emcibacter sp.]